MSTEPESPRQRRRRFMADDIVAALAVIAILLAGLALYIARTQDDTPVRPPVTAGDEVTVERAEAILARAEDSSNAASNLLSFLETGSGVAALILGVGAFMLRRSILEQVDKAQELSRRTEEKFKEQNQALIRREDRLGAFQETLMDELDEIRRTTREQLDEIRRSTADQIAGIQQQVKNSFRVVSLQLLAEQQSRERNTQTAIDTLQRIHKLDPDNQATNYLLGYLYMGFKKLDLAIEHLDRALAVDPDFTPAIAAMGLALRRKGDALDETDDKTERNKYWDAARTRLQQALNKDPRLTDTEGESYYGTLGGLFRRQGHYYAALDAYEWAHKVTPKSSYPIINLAALHAHQGNHEQAQHYFNLVIKNALLQLDDDPRDAWSRMDYAQALLVLGDQDKALEELQTVIDQQPEWIVLSTVLSGLKFLAESTQPIEGADRMIALLEAELQRRDDGPEQ